MELLQDPAFWLAVGQIILIDILLGGDNAIVIALACRGLPEQQRRRGILLGTMGAILIRVVLIGFALTLLGVPYLKLVGAALLAWIGIKLLTGEDEDHEVNASEKLWGAVKTIVIADLVMSVDNVVGVAAAAEAGGGDHKLTLVIFGLLVSIPIVVWGSTFVLRLMDRFPWVVTLGGMLMGWIAGTMAVTDPALLPHVPTIMPSEAIPGAVPKVQTWFYQTAGVLGALLVVLVGQVKKRLGAAKDLERELPP
jgi:YjbE family integral membrane protein